MAEQGMTFCVYTISLSGCHR